MKLLRPFLFAAWIVFLSLGAARGADHFRTDTFQTSKGALEITFLGHASLRMHFRGKYYYVDPCSSAADFSTMEKADVIFFTNRHKDHFDLKALRQLSEKNTLVVLPEICAMQYREGLVMKNEDSAVIRGLPVQCVAAYNIVDMSPSGFPYNFKGIGNGYVIGFGDKRVYVAGNTEKIPEMNELGPIDIAFLPVALPDAMSLEMAADAVRAIKPAVFYPYRYGKTDIARLKEMLTGERETVVRIRDMK
ncbi:MAG: MBL fold metallo-hydrolase [Syntrophobacteraceae bacterium]|nr:MBL fold metallo-hydrolase [Syntrophobacteraceae bacterium]